MRTCSAAIFSAATRSSSGAVGTLPEPTELSGDEAAAYWLEVLRVGRAIESCFEPVKLNYDLLGNSLPHLHIHIVPRYADDPRPGWPFPFPDEKRTPIEEQAFRRDVEALRHWLG
jgi:diadenosine tetraphosphate (Ap4A) HIT family hydrolase